MSALRSKSFPLTPPGLCSNRDSIIPLLLPLPIGHLYSDLNINAEKLMLPLDAAVVFDMGRQFSAVPTALLWPFVKPRFFREVALSITFPSVCFCGFGHLLSGVRRNWINAASIHPSAVFGDAHCYTGLTARRSVRR